MQEAKIIRNSESGQASVMLIVMLSTFLLGSLAFSVDFGYLWFRRQAAQTAADAACQAGAMDMLYLARGTTPPAMGFTPGTSGDCTSSSSSTMCWYANRNGFNGAGYTATTAGSKVSWTFPASTSVTGVQAANVTNPFLKVTVQENIKTWFMALLGKDFQEVGASCTCGLMPGPAPAPLIILHPTLSGALTSTGGTTIQITGGPQTSINIDSNSSTAFLCLKSSPNLLDTSTAGPHGTGGDVDLAGGPSANPTCGGGLAWNGGSTGSWIGGVTSLNQKTPDGTTMANDPYKDVPAPNLPGVPAEASNPVDSPDHHQVADGANGFDRGTWVATGVDSCPNINPNQQYMWYSAAQGKNVYANCLEFTPGYYPTGIDLTSIPGAGSGSATVIFMPGIYYMNGNLKVGSSTTIRNAWPATQPSTQGVVFYFVSGAPQFSGGSGAANSNINPVPSYYLNCSGTTTPSGMPASLNGNVLVGQCSTNATYVGSTSTDTYSASGSRGLLFFLAHSNVYSGTIIGNGASLIFSGAFYFHNTTFQDKVEWDGAGASTTYAVGNIVADQLTIGGSGSIKMGLNGIQVGAGPPLVGFFQ